MRKILIVANRMDCGGTEVAVLSIIHELLKDESNQITLLLQFKEGVWLNRVPSEIKVIEYNGYRGLREIAEKLTGLKKLFFMSKCFMRKMFYRGHYDLLLEYLDNFKEEFDVALDINGYGYFLTAYVAKKIHAKKKATWFHDEDLSWLFKIKAYLGDFNKLYCVSTAVQKQLMSIAPETKEKTEVLYNPIDIHRIRKKSKELITPVFDKNKVSILTVGRIHPQKGIKVAIETAKILKVKNLPFVWYFIGDGEARNHYEQLIQDENLSDVLVFLGRKDNPYPYMAACDIYVQPSLHEGYGLTVLEARVLKKLIVASDLPCFREQITDSVNGFLCKPTPDAFACCIEKILSEPIENYKNIAEQESKVDFTSEIEKLYNMF